MRQFLFSIVALLASVTVLLIGTGLMGTLVSMRLTIEAMTAEPIAPWIKGLILSAYYIGLVAGSQWAGRIVRQAGHIRAFAIFAAVCTAAVLAQGLSALPVLWFLLRVLIGFSIAGIYIVVESWLNERADAGSRGRVFSIYQILSYVALGLGQFLLPLGDPAGAELFMAVGILFALCLVPVAMSKASTPPEPTPHRPIALRETLRGSPLAVWTCMASGLMSSAMFTLTPGFAVRMELDVTAVSGLMASLILGGVTLQWPIGHLSDRYGRQPLILVVGAAGGVLALVLGLAAPVFPSWALMVTAAALGGFTFTFYPLAVSQANDRIRHRADFVAVAGALLFLWGVSAALGPILAGLVITATGLSQALFLNLAAVSLATALIAVLRRSESGQALEPYRTMSRTTTVIAELDPRGHGTEPPPEGDAPAAVDRPGRTET